MSKKWKILFFCIFIFFILFFLIQIGYKNLITGKNMSKSSDDVIQNILNLSSYEAEIQITIQSNKTSNQYILEQYYLEPGYAKQIVKEPVSIANLETVYNGKNLSIKNTNLGLTKIYENYPYLHDNILWLPTFLQNFQDEGILEESEEEIILLTNHNPYSYHQKLYISKKTGIPTKLETIDNSKHTQIYIEYKEIKLNTIQENNIFAFQTKDIRKEV